MVDTRGTRVLNFDPLTLDPGLCVDLYSRQVIDHLNSGLIEHTPEMDIQPDMAQHWNIQEGGRRYVFHLREDVKWSDRTPVTAEDFVYAWQRVLNPATLAPNAELLYDDIKGARAYHQGETSDTESLGIRAKGLYTLELNSKHLQDIFCSSWPMMR
jgi:ABC-type oligopeptide transport system substrate-binding subunit